jgi:hypothetical protein
MGSPSSVRGCDVIVRLRCHAGTLKGVRPEVTRRILPGKWMRRARLRTGLLVQLALDQAKDVPESKANRTDRIQLRTLGVTVSESPGSTRVLFGAVDRLVASAVFLDEPKRHLGLCQIVADVALWARRAGRTTGAGALYVAPGPIGMRFANPSSVTALLARRRHSRSLCARASRKCQLKRSRRCLCGMKGSSRNAAWPRSAESPIADTI